MSIRASYSFVLAFGVRGRANDRSVSEWRSGASRTFPLGLIIHWGRFYCSETSLFVILDPFTLSRASITATERSSLRTSASIFSFTDLTNSNSLRKISKSCSAAYLFDFALTYRVSIESVNANTAIIPLAAAIQDIKWHPHQLAQYPLPWEVSPLRLSCWTE